MPDTLFMIHGMWGGPWCWDNYRAFFQQAGYQCLTPTLRGHDVAPQDPPPPGLGRLSLLDYAQDLESQISALPQPPIIMGHSMGGLLAQMLAARGLGKAAVCITPATPRGVMALRFSVIKSFWSAIWHFRFLGLPHRPTLAEASYSMMHLLTPEEQRQNFGRFVHESGRATAEIGFWLLHWGKKPSAVDEKAIQCPLLVVAAGQDRITPAAVVSQLQKKYTHGATFKVFPEHAHWILAEPGWRDVAGYILDWLQGEAKR
ncbi:MAG: alpha/beta hydrolase [Desulfarculus sp.]|nr:alpha/beta hydrolase [Desulfarculus sp.]